MDNELFHYRTPGSKNGVRLYQHLDGSLTALGEMRYLKGEKTGNKHYYETGYKPGLLDFYGKAKQKELNKYIRNNGGNKNYKGYERSEAKEFKYDDPKKSAYDMHQKIIDNKPAAQREKKAKIKELLRLYNESNKQNQNNSLSNDASSKFVNSNSNSLIASYLVDDKNIDNGKDFLRSIMGSRNLLDFLYRSVKWAVNNQNIEDDQIPIEKIVRKSDIQDTHAGPASAWLHIGKKRMKDLASAGKDRLQKEKKETERSVGVGLGKMYWKKKFK